MNLERKAAYNESLISEIQTRAQRIAYKYAGQHQFNMSPEDLAQDCMEKAITIINWWLETDEEISTQELIAIITTSMVNKCNSKYHYDRIRYDAADFGGLKEETDEEGAGLYDKSTEAWFGASRLDDASDQLIVRDMLSMFKPGSRLRKLFLINGYSAHVFTRRELEDEGIVFPEGIDDWGNEDYKAALLGIKSGAGAGSYRDARADLRAMIRDYLKQAE